MVMAFVLFTPTLAAAVVPVPASPVVDASFGPRGIRWVPSIPAPRGALAVVMFTCHFGVFYFNPKVVYTTKSAKGVNVPTKCQVREDCQERQA